ncbi:hypothetical protein TNCV_3356551 [Trichonephila clavipes]|nr:hypothetical protein TNCV_3356551 [Trichonephila clavipes]
MERFTNTKLADMRLIYGLAEGNARAAERVYCKSEGELRVTRTPSKKQNVLDTVRRNPSTSVRIVAVSVGGPWSTVHSALQREGLHPYYLQRIPPRHM